MLRAPKAISDRRRAVLELLKRRGPSAAGELAARLGVSPTAVRQHMVGLAREGLVVREREVRGVGRPASVWRLTELAERFFPDGHAALCVELGHALGSSLRKDQIRRVASALVRAQAHRYRSLIPRRGGLLARLRALVAVRTEEGYMAELTQPAAGGFDLVANHCPVGVAAQALPMLCAAEARALQAALGGVPLRFIERRVNGSRRCVVRVGARR